MHHKFTDSEALEDGAKFTVNRDIGLVRRHWRLALGAYLAMVLAGTMAYATLASVKSFDLAKRSWGGFDERPTTAKCYRQERTAMILSFLLGTLGVDQFYAGHWPLAVFKLLTAGGFGFWSFVDIILWMVGGVYGTPGCPGGSKHDWQY